MTVRILFRILWGAVFIAELALAQEIVVRFTSPVSVKQQAQTYSSADANIQGLLKKYLPLHITTFGKQRRHSLPSTLSHVQVWRLPSVAAVGPLLKELRELPGVVYAEANHRYRIFNQPDDPLFVRQWYLETIRAEAAWTTQRGDPAVIVGIIDTGIDYRHQDLQGRIWINTAEDRNRNGQRDSLDFNGIDEDGNGYVDDVIGWDFTDAPNFPDQGDFRDPDNDPRDEFSSGHGTPIAGLIAATQNNGIGISGIAPGVRVMALRAGTSAGFLEEDDVAEAILYAVDNGCQIINMSFGDVAYSYLLRDAIQYGVSRGVIFVASAGNDGNAVFHYPAAFGETIAVSASDSGDGLAGFSSYGSKINLSAPGQNVFAPMIGDRYGLHNGTSFAAPIVSGAAALIWSQFPDFTPEQVKGALYAGARDAGFGGWDVFFGHGIVDLARSLAVGRRGFAEISAPVLGSALAGEQIAIIGSAYGPEFLSYSLAYGSGENPPGLTALGDPATIPVLRDTLGMWPVAALNDTVYTLEVRLRQRNLPDVVYRSAVYLDRSSPQMLSRESVPLLVGSQSGYLLRLQSDDPAVATLHYRPVGERGFSLSKISPYFEKEHYFLLSQQDIAGEVEYFLELRNGAGLTGRFDNDGHYFQISLPEIAPAENIFISQPPLPLSGFLMPAVSDFNANQIPEVVFSELIGQKRFGGVQIGEFRGGRWEFHSLTAFPLLPREAGNIFPEGGTALLGGFGNRALLLGANPAGDYPREVVWADTTDFWASRLANYDADPDLEILGRRLGRWQIFDISRDFQVTEQQTLEAASAGSNQFGVPWTLLVDLDGDGRREIIFEDLDGDLYRYEEDPEGEYRLSGLLRLPGKGGNGLLQAGDLDGDGQKELLTVVRRQPPVLRESNVNSQYWVLTAWRATGDDGLEEIGRVNVHGVTVQTGIQNGLGVADLDGDGTDEVIFTPFPGAYVLTYDRGGFEMRWHRGDVNSNAALVADFDQNGRRELLLNSDAGILRFELSADDQRPQPPARLQAAAVDTTRVRLSWHPSPAAHYYRIYRRSAPDLPLLGIDSSQTPVYVDTAVTAARIYSYAVTQVNRDFPQPESFFSNLVTVRPNDPPRFQTAAVLPPRQLLLQFSEPLSAAAYRTDHYRLYPGGTLPVSAIRGRSRQQVLLSFLEEFSPGGSRLVIRGLTDATGTPQEDDSLTVSFDYQPPGAPFYLQQVTFLHKKLLKLSFNRAVDPHSAAQTRHYRLEPEGRVVAATIDSSERSAVYLHLAGENRLGGLGVSYYLSVSGLQDHLGSYLDSLHSNRLAVQVTVNDLEKLLVYPNPYPVRSAAQPLRFGNAPRGCEIFIFNASGQSLRRLTVEDQSGGVVWDLKTAAGREVGSGVYVFLARYQGREKKGKILVVQ